MKGDDSEIAQLVLDHIAFLIKPKFYNTAEGIAQKWSHLRAFYASPQFKELAQRFPEKLAAFVDDGIYSPLFDGAIPYVLAPSKRNGGTAEAADLKAIRARHRTIIKS